MMEICGDNRFEIIAKAKADLLESTNIETDEAEMAVIDNILFRCWQMGWLDRYDRKTEPIPRDDYIELENDHLEARCLNCNNAKACKEKHWEGCIYEPKDEKTCETCRYWKYIAHEWQCETTKCQGYTPKIENSSEKPNNCEYVENPSGDVWECGCFLDTYCEHQIYDRNPDGTINIVECGYEPKDKPQTKCYLRTSCDHYGDKQVCVRCREYNLYSHTKTKPQTERSE